MHISVCICTYKRPRLLRKLLTELGRQETADEFTYSLVVTDNDRDESARQVVEEVSSQLSLTLRYCVEPVQNIALARNRAVRNGNGEFLAFIDDDEFPEPMWLLTMFRQCQRSEVDGVLGPVRPFFEGTPPKWLTRGRLCERPEHPTGFVVPWTEARTGNVLVRSRIVREMAEPFRPQFGSGSEDTDFFRRLINGNSRVFVWCNEAPVFETVEPQRWKRRFWLRRALLRGQNQRYLANASSVGKSLCALPLYTALLPFTVPFGQHVVMRYLIRLMDHLGKVLAAAGFEPVGDHYVEL